MSTPRTRQNRNQVAHRRRLLLLALAISSGALIVVSLGALALRGLPAPKPTPIPVAVIIPTPEPTPTPVPEPTPPAVAPFDFALPAPQSAAVEDDYFADALFIGDSRSDGLRLYSGIRGADFLAYKALMVFEVTGTHNIQQKKIPVGDTKMTVLDALELKQYAKVYLMLGINELGWGKNEEFSDAFLTLIDEVRKRQPDAIIYIESIIPVNPEKCAANKSPAYFNNEKIALFNDLLKQVALDKKVVYLDLADGMTDGTGTLAAEGTTDGIHFVRSYYTKWYDYLKTHTADAEAYTAGQEGA